LRPSLAAKADIHFISSHAGCGVDGKPRLSKRQQQRVAYGDIDTNREIK
jgi:hypothetical protein